MANQTCNPSIITQALGIQATGPRTVIVPADPIIWDAEISYEYLTLVASTDFGQAYISKKDVPAGTALTDTDYWIPAASYNAQLAQVQQDMGQLEGELDAKASYGDVYGSANTAFTFIPFADWYDSTINGSYAAQSMTSVGNTIVVLGEQNDSAQIAWTMNASNDSVVTTNFTDANNHVNGCGYRDNVFYIVSNAGTVQERNAAMNLLNTHTLTAPITAIDTFGTDQFVGRDDGNVYILNSDFTVASQFTIPQSAVTQGICSNGSIIYVVNGNNIQMYDASGNALGVIYSTLQCEFEDMCVMNGNLYVLINPSNKGFVISNLTMGSNGTFNSYVDTAIEMVQDTSVLCKNATNRVRVHNPLSLLLLSQVMEISSVHVNTDLAEIFTPTFAYQNKMMYLLTDEDHVDVSTAFNPYFQKLIIGNNVTLKPTANLNLNLTELICQPTSTNPSIDVSGENSINIPTGTLTTSAGQKIVTGGNMVLSGCNIVAGSVGRASTAFSVMDYLETGITSGQVNLADFGKCLIHTNAQTLTNCTLAAELSATATGDVVVAVPLRASAAHALTFTGASITTGGQTASVVMAFNAGNETLNLNSAKINDATAYVRRIYVIG